MEIPEADWQGFFALLDYLEKNKPPSDARMKALEDARRPDFITMSEAQISKIINSPKPQALSFLQRSDAQEYIKSIANDLGAQVKIVSDQISDQLQFGETMAPAYANRIGIILRKAKRKDLSDRFDVAYGKHDAASA
jgi:hypothetical protein